MTSHLLKTLREVLMDAVHVSFDFFKVLIPISIAMKILAELDWIRYLALPLEPVMQLTGLPADLGIAWATGIMVNFYSALIVFIGLLPGLPPLTTEQVTTLAVMMLIAHSIPAEGRIAAQCGVSFIGQAVIRLVVAVIGGVIVHTSCQAFGWLDTPARIVFTPSPDVNLLWWALGEVRNLVSIFCVIFFVMLLQRFLRYLKVADLIGRALAPALRVLGMRPAAATAMIVGVMPAFETSVPCVQEAKTQAESVASMIETTGISAFNVSASQPSTPPAIEPTPACKNTCVGLSSACSAIC